MKTSQARWATQGACAHHALLQLHDAIGPHGRALRKFDQLQSLFNKTDKPYIEYGFFIGGD
jgi:hypothetical protein